jgi:hypothetical protein
VKAAVVAALAPVLAVPAAAPATSSVSLSIGRSAFRPDEGVNLPAGQTYWFFDYRVTVRSVEPCAYFTLDWRYRILADGRLEQSGAHDEGSQTDETAGTTARFELPVGFGPSPGEVVVLDAVGACHTPDGRVATSRRTQRAVQIPPFSCRQGPLRVLAVRGRAWREEEATENHLVPIRRGDFLWTAYWHVLGRRAHIVFGAPQCHGYRVALQGHGGFDPGTYARRARGDYVAMTLGMSARLRGDQHGGAIFVDGAFVQVRPRGLRYGRVRIAAYELRSWGRRSSPRTRLIVHRGAVWLTSGRARPVLVRAPENVLVGCDARANCWRLVTRGSGR